MNSGVAQFQSSKDDQSKKWFPFMKWGSLIVINLACWYTVGQMYQAREIAFALLLLIVVTTASYVYSNKKSYTHRYVYPAVAAMAIFIVFPMLYTIGIGFTNYSSSNLLSDNRVEAFHLSKIYTQPDSEVKFKLYESGEGQFNVQLENTEGGYLVSENFSMDQTGAVSLSVIDAPTEAEALPLKALIEVRKQFKALTFESPDGTVLTMSGLRTLAAQQKLYTLLPDGSLKNNLTQNLAVPNIKTGFYEENGEVLTPGFRVYQGWDNFEHIVTDPGIKEPFFKIFIWTVTFSLLTVLFTLAIGLILACLVSWEMLTDKQRLFYRIMLIVPYAVPAFISILVFKGLFNFSYGEINKLIDGVAMMFGASEKVGPNWFSDPVLAKAMVLMVNTWLGYPYMMILGLGLLQSISKDLYEASAMDGAGPIDNFLNITLPLILKPMVPLLIASFAFNFNNFMIIILLTNGGPDMIGASTVAGHTDLLVSYTYRIAFQDSGQNFGLASAIATIIFLMVGTMALINLKITKTKIA